MATRLLFICICAFFLLATIGCAEEETVPVLEERPAPVTRADAPATAKAGEAVAIDVYFLVDNGCGQFGSFDVTASPKEQTIQVKAVYKGDICTEDRPTRKITYTFKPTNSGTYTLRFRSTPSVEYITATIEVGGPR